MRPPSAPRTSAALSFREGFCQPEARRRVLTAAILASAVGFIDGSLVAIAMPAMRDGLGATLTQAQWINNAYMLPLSALILAGGALGDRFGLSRIFAAGIVVFVLASLASALAPSAEALIAARALKGIGAAAMIPGSLALIYRAYPKEERGQAIGIWAASASLTTALGPVLAGAALTLLGPEAWRWLFAINLPLGAFALWFLFSAVEEDRGNPERGVDVAGAILASLGLGLAAWVLTELAAPGAEGLWLWGLIAAGAFLAFLAWEARTADPMMPLGLFASPTFSAANLVTLFLYLGLSAVLFFLPMTVITGWGISAAAASAAFLPITGFIALFSARAGRLADKHGARGLIALGSGITGTAFAGLGLLAPAEVFWGGVLPMMALFGLGMCLVVAPLSSAVMAAVPETSAGAASGVNNAVSRIGGLIAVAAMGAVAAGAYAGAGGPESFGAEVTAEGHGTATNAAFRAVAYASAALAWLSAGIAWVGIAPKGQTGS